MTTNPSWMDDLSPTLDGRDWSQWSFVDLSTRCDQLQEREIENEEPVELDADAERLHNEERLALRMFGVIACVLAHGDTTLVAMRRRQSLQEQLLRPMTSQSRTDLVWQITRIELEIGTQLFGSGPDDCWPFRPDEYL